MIDEDDSQLLRRTLHPAALAALGRAGGFRALAGRVLEPSRPALREARQAVADVLFALHPSRVRRFEARNVLHFDLRDRAVQCEAARDAWETLCTRLDLPWLDDDGRRFVDRVARTWRSREGGRVVVHREATGGAVQTVSLDEERLLEADDPVAVLRDCAAGPMYLEHPPTLAAVVSLTSAHAAVAMAEALAWEAVRPLARAVSPPPRIVWRFEDRARLLATRATELAVLRRGVGALEDWAERTGAWQRFHPAVAAPFEAVMAIYETGMLLDAVTPEGVSLVCPLTA